MTVTQSPQLDGRSSRRVRAAVILFSGVYGMAVTGLSFLIGRASPPNLWTVGIFQTLFVPIGITALYTAYTVDARAVGFVGLAPVCGALLVASGVLLVGPSLPPLSEIGVGVATVAVITLAPSGAWTVLGIHSGRPSGGVGTQPYRGTASGRPVATSPWEVSWLSSPLMQPWRPGFRRCGRSHDDSPHRQ